MNKTTVVFCIDGFDPEYLDFCEMPNIREIAKQGFQKIGRCIMPSVTNVNNVSLTTASYPEVHGICSNYWYIRDKCEGVYTESADYIKAETFFERCSRLNLRSLLVTSKDKLRSLLAEGATNTISSEKPPQWVVDGVGPAPEIYSLEVNGWVIDAANFAMTQQHADVVYITTTDYAMHTFHPEHPESQRHISILDRAIGDLVEAHPDVTLLITADHGMSTKTRMVDLAGALAKYDIRATMVPIIKDRYVVHHANLGGCMFGYLDPSIISEALRVLREVPGVQDAFTREEAAAKFNLLPERIGDVVVTGVKDTVFGDPSEVELPPTLRSHGSTHEQSIPIIGYNGEFDGFLFEENKDLGRYIFERVLAST